MLMLPAVVAQTTEPLMFWSFPSMRTFVPPPVLPPPTEVLPPPELDFLSEQPESPAAKIAAAATATVSPRFTCAPLPIRRSVCIEDRFGSMRVDGTGGLG